MPAHSFDRLFRSLTKGDLAPVYYLHGPEDVLKDEAVRTILDRALDPAARDFNYDQRSASQLDPEAIYALCYTLPMMAERRVVVLRDVEDWKRKTKGRAEFLRYLERPSSETVVILIQGAGEEDEDKELARGAYTVRFDPLPPERALKWMLRRAGQLGVTLEPEVAQHLVRAVGADLGALESELAKLASLPQDEPLTVERVGELVGIRHGETLWDWAEAVLDDQPARAIALLPRVLAQPGVSGVKLVTQLGTALVGVSLARSLLDKGARGSALENTLFRTLLKVRPWGLLGYKEEAARWARWAPQWTVGRLRAALRAARETDEALKTTTISDERGLLTDLVLRMTQWKDGEGGKDGSGAKMTGSNRGARRLAGTMLSILSALSIFSALSAAPASAQTDPRLVDVIRDAQEGRSDSARAKVKRLLASTSAGDTLYPQILYTQAMVASDAAEMRRQLQRVAVEYSSSSWADDALLRLVQLDYASGNLEGAARNLERIRRDYPGSLLLPQTSYWAARTYFDQKKPELACRWLTDGVAASRGNVELQNQLGYLNQRCAGVRVDTAVQLASDSQPAPTLTGTVSDTALTPASNPDSLPAVRPPAPAPQPAPAAAARTDSTPPARITGRPTIPSGRFRIQVTAVRTPAAAEAIAKRLKAKGLDAVTVPEGGLYKVRVGSYGTRTEAIAAVPAVKAKFGGSPFVVAEP
jgi:DNA polymerase III subunit delta